jgi:hypothetical protein
VQEFLTPSKLGTLNDTLFSPNVPWHTNIGMHSTFQRCCKGILILYAQTLKPNILHVCIIYHPLVFGA